MKPRLLMMGTLAALITSACVAQPAAPAPAPEQQVATAASAATEAPAAAPAGQSVELLWWDSYANQPDTEKMVLDVIAEFEKRNPGVKIKREVQDFASQTTLVKTALASGTGPDIVLGGSGEGFMGPLVEANLLLPLDPYIQQYGWKDRIFPWTWKAGVEFGGKTYGIGHELEMIGVYYNADLFTEKNWEVPKTFEEFQALAQKAKDAGLIPIAFGDKPGWPAFHTFSTFANNFLGPDKMKEVMCGKVKWTDPQIVEAIKVPFVDMNKAGFYKDPTALEYEDANNLFWSGKAAMNLTGMWLYADMLANSKAKVGFFPMPAPGGKTALPAGGLGSALMISAASKNADTAAALLDLFFSKEMAPKWVENAKKISSVDIDVTALNVDPLFKGFAESIVVNSRQGGTGLGYNIDVYTPASFNDIMLNGFQAVLGGSRTPEEQAKALQDAWDKYYSGKTPTYCQ